MREFSRNPEGLGYIVLYGTSSKTNLTFDKAKGVMKTQGLNSGYLRKPSGRIAFSRCAKEIEKEYPDKFTRKVVETKNEKIIVVVHESLDEEAEELEFKQETRAVFNKKEGTFHAEGPDAAEMEMLFNRYSFYVTGDDIRQMARKVVEKSNGISLRGGTFVKDTGGVYFIPVTHAEQMEALATILEDLEIGYLKAFSVFKGKSEQLAVFETLDSYINREIDLIDNAVDNITSKPSYLKEHQKRIEKLEVLLNDYADLTGMKEKAELSFKKVQETKNKASKKILALSK